MDASIDPVLLTQIGISGAAVTLVINVISSGLKKYIYPKFGKLGIQVFSFILALIAAWFFVYGRHIESLMTLVGAAGTLFSAAMVLYEVILSRFSWFKDVSPEVQAARAQASKPIV